MSIYLGQSLDGHYVFADVTIRREHKQVQFTDHSYAPSPEEVAISFTIVDAAYGSRPRNVDRIADRWVLRLGQVPADERVIPNPEPHTRAIERAWAEAHLNTMLAACDHMTDAMLNPTEEQMAEYVAAHPVPTSRYPGERLMDYRLDTVLCPVTRYRYGHAWLAKTVPADVIDPIRAIATVEGVAA